MNEKRLSTGRLVKLAMMTAVSVVLLMLVRVPFPPAPFLVYDPADIPIYIAAFAFGPVEALVMTFVVCVTQAFALGGDGIYGFLMHFVATGLMAVIIGIMYRRNKTRGRAVAAIIIGVATCILTMTGMNLIVTPLYTGMPREAVAAMIIPVLLPFNLLKAGLNGALTFVLYKRISGFLHNETTVGRNTEKKRAG